MHVLGSRIQLTDGNKRISALLENRGFSPVDAVGAEFLLPAANGAPRVITLDHSTASPRLTAPGASPGVGCGTVLRFLWNPSPTWGGGTQFTFEREDHTVIATIDGSAAPEITIMRCWVEFVYTGTNSTDYAWRLGFNSGAFLDSTPAYFGVIAGAGA
jgi:hypothetical protein